MFERYTQPARRVIFFARREALQLGCSEIDTQHIVLGLLRESPQLMHTFLAKEQADKIRSEIEAKAPPQRRDPSPTNIPLSSGSKLVLAYAAREADAMGYAYVDSSHLLAGILMEKESFGARLLLDREVTLPPLRHLLKTTPHRRVLPRRPSFLPDLRIFSLLFLFLLAFQIAAKMFHFSLPKDDATFYSIALPATFAVHSLLLWTALKRGAVALPRCLQYAALATIIFLLAIAPVLHSLLPGR